MNSLTGNKRAPLTRERIVDEALRLIDTDGLEGFSTRKLGAALGVEAMSIYHHFPSKGHLLDAVSDRLVGALEIPGPGDGDWQERLRLSVHRYRELCRAHPRALLLIAARRFNTPGALGVLERLLGIFRDAGFDAAASAQLFRMLGYYQNGALLSEITILQQMPDSTGSAIDSGQVGEPFPNVRAAAPYLGPAHLDENFEAGLEVLLAHFAALHSGVGETADNRERDATRDDRDTHL